MAKTKLSPAQVHLLQEVCAYPRLHTYKFTCVWNYKPALKLVELGFATSQELNYGRISLEPTEAGRAENARLNPEPNKKEG